MGNVTVSLGDAEVGERKMIVMDVEGITRL
jgi:hypothetical protein